ncbi:MAG: ATP-binding cassette domain-containing protein [Lachnospiraceae bacterium]|nr:ATP-binding cassette domain-containing protein [Lachnospiraceae bacterium]
MLKVENLSYKVGKKAILRDVNIEFYPGEMTFIIGPSGSGKTTLLNMLGCLERASSGHIYLDGSDIMKDTDRYRACDVGFVFQDYNLIESMSAAQNVKIAMDYSGADAGYDFAKTYADFNIKDFNQNSKSMSGGEKQRIAIIRSLCKNSRVILADEPTGNLDPDNAYIVLDELAKMKKDRCIIVVSHDHELARQYADRIVTIADGCVKSDSGSKIENKKSVDNNKPKRKRRNLAANLKAISSSIRKRFIKLVAISFVLALAVAILCTSKALYDYNDFNMKKLNVNYLETDMIYVYEDNQNYVFSGWNMGGLFDSDIEYINGLKPVETVYIYTDNENTVLYHGSNEYHIPLRQININDFFRERIMSEHIKGSFLEKENETIPASDVAMQLYGTTDCIGSIVTIGLMQEYAVDFKIVGINDLKDINDKIWSYVSAKAFVEQTKRYKQDVVMEYVGLEDGPRDNSSMITAQINHKVAIGSASLLDDGVEVVYGRLPERDGEVCVDIESLWRTWGTEKFDEWFAKYKDCHVKTQANGMLDYVVTGLVDDKDPEDCNIYLTKNDYDTMSELRPSYMQLYVKNPKDAAKICKNLDETDRFRAEIRNEMAKERILSQGYSSRRVIETLSIAFFVMAVVIFVAFILIDVLSRTYEIGIIKSLGAKRSDIFCILMADSVVISLIASVAGFVMTKIACKMAPKMIEGFELFTVAFVPALFMKYMCMMIGVVVLSVLFVTVIYSGKSCAKLMK